MNRETIEKKIAKLTAQLNKTIRGQNAAFWKLPKAKQRVRIAQDVIDQVKADIIHARAGVYFRTDDIKPEDVSDDVQISALLPKVESCDACALGSMFKCAVERADKIQIKDAKTGFVNEYVGGSDKGPFYADGVHAYVRKFFPSRQVALIESCFERDREHLYNSDSGDDYTVAFIEGYGPSDVKERLLAIMSNIVRNRGTFKPEQDMCK